MSKLLNAVAALPPGTLTEVARDMRLTKHINYLVGALLGVGCVLNVTVVYHPKLSLVQLAFAAILLAHAQFDRLVNDVVVQRPLILLFAMMVLLTGLLGGERLSAAYYVPMLVYIAIVEQNKHWRMLFCSGVAAMIPVHILLVAHFGKAHSINQDYLISFVNIVFAIGSCGYLFGLFIRRIKDIYSRRKAALTELEQSVDLLREANVQLNEQLMSNQLARRSLQQSITNAHLTRAQLEASNEQLEQFAYAASHDLKEPVRTIRSFMQMARRKLPATVAADNKLLEEFAFVEDNALAMHALLERLLVYSRAGRLEACAKTFAFPRICQQAVVGLQCSPELKRNLITQLAALPAVQVYADSEGVQTALREVLVNALTYVRDGREPEITITIEVLDGRALCQVRDAGIGIEPKYLEQVFGLFKRLHPREIYPGAGIGLTLARRTIEQSGGEICLSSEVEQGTTATIILPLAQEV